MVDFKNRYISSEYIFSEWIFAWFLIYISPMNENRNIAEQYFNPLLSLCIALFSNVVTFIFLLTQTTSLNIIIKYLLMSFCEKVVPIYLLTRYTSKSQVKFSDMIERNELQRFIAKYFKSLHLQTNIPFTTIFFLVYLGYLQFRSTNFCEVYNSIIHSIIIDDNNTPFFALFHILFGL
jgi:hypothetical protein